MKIAGKE
ncbi:tonB-system energizer ExbB, partial [Yersinia pestis PY-25]